MHRQARTRGSRAEGARRPGLRLRLLAMALTPAVIGIGLSTAYLYERALEAAGEALDRRGRELAGQLALAAEFDDINGDRRALERLLDHAAAQPEVLSVGILQANGQWLVPSRQAQTPSPVLPPAGTHAGGSGGHRVYVHLFRPAGETAHPPVARPQGPGGQAVVVLGTQALDELRWRVLIGAALVPAAVLPLVALLAWRLGLGLERRLRAVNQAVEHLADGGPSDRLTVGSADALGQLEANLNRLAATLQASRAALEARLQAATADLAAQRQAAEAAVQAKSRFLAAASHDLRQPLHALSLLVAALKERLTSNDTLHLARQIEASALAMQTLLNGLLDLSRLDAGVVQANPQCFPLMRLLQGLQRQYAPIAAEKGLTLQVRPTQAWVQTDPVLLERILGNLLANAIRYTDSGWVALGTRLEQDHLRVEVWDTGPGIPPAYQERIFEEYFQLQNPERARDKGLGLGLAIVARLARLLGTPINLDSTPGRGSCFSLRLPICAPQAQTPEPEGPPTGTALQDALVAFIDDDPGILEAMVLLLDEWGVEVAAGTDVAQVQADLAQLGRRPDVIVADYRLGGGCTGIEAIAALRRAFGADIPALLVTGDTAPETIRAIQASGLPVLHKPLKPAKLRALLAHLVGDREQRKAEGEKGETH